MMTDEELISKIVWNVNLAPKARVSYREELAPGVTVKLDKRVPKWTISGNLAPQKPGDLPIGEAQTFKYEATQAHIEAATRSIQKKIIASYRQHNDVEKPAVPTVSRQELVQGLKDAWTLKDLKGS